MTKKQIDKIGRSINSRFFSLYKRNLFFEYYDLNKIATEEFLNRINKLLKKLDITLKSYEYKYLNMLVEEEFAVRRAKKSIDTTFPQPSKIPGKQFPMFLEKNVVIFHKNNLGIYTYVDNMNLYFYNSFLVLEKDMKVFETIHLTTLEQLKHLKIGVELKKTKQTWLFKSKNNNILMTYFKRSIYVK